MIHTTIRIDTENGNSRTRTMNPCDLAVFIGASRKGNGIRTQTAVVGSGISEEGIVFLLANESVDMLLEVCGDSRERQARILKAYVDNFTDAMAKKAGTVVMDKIVDIIMDEE